MSDRNVAIVQRCYELFARAIVLRREGEPDEWARIEGWSEVFDPEVVLEELPEIPDAATYRGLAEVQRWFREGNDAFEDVRWDPRAFVANDPHVLVDLHGSFRGGSSGADVEVDLNHVFTLRNGRIVHVRGFLDRARAREAAGLPASGEAGTAAQA